jgi:alpha-L-fucosidase
VKNEDAIRYTAKGEDVYAICTKWPGRQLRLAAPKPTPGAEIQLLGCEGPIPWKMEGDQLVINVPQLTVDQLPCEHMWVLKIFGAAKGAGDEDLLHSAR